MRVVNADQLRKACETVSTELRSKGLSGRDIVNACDTLANSPVAARMIVEALETVSPVGKP